MAALIAIPVYNEARHFARVLESTLTHGIDVLVVDDGSTDDTGKILQRYPHVSVIRHAKNRGYGAALRAAFDYAIRNRYDVVITMDSDGQHEPSLIPEFIDKARTCDIVSGSRYAMEFVNDTPAPAERRRINSLVTDELNAALGFRLTDSFCGFKAYQTSALRRLTLTEDGYGMPLELWVEAACRGLRIVELPVPRIYIDQGRTFGNGIDDADSRLAYYQTVIDRAVRRVRARADCQRQAAADPDFYKSPL